MTRRATSAALRLPPESGPGSRELLEWCLSGGEVEQGVRLAEALWRFWDIRGHLREGRQWLERAVERSQPGTALRAEVVTGAGHLALRQGDFAAARAFAEESLAVRRQLHDRRGIAVALNNLANSVAQQQDYPLARALYEESLSLAREQDDQTRIAGLLNNLGVTGQLESDHPDPG